ncbi:hypothetical protein [Fusobacterium periodonticum]|uniref:Uncharacterized protein n=1 Tax=Fusobacterium periodonticum 1_1_41FAA TaxID=469621 RepID=D6LHK5_9FUSO|nr:hypothetical protein [Fusobacterium periodonticum]EFG27881.1 hypothetical protein HMPREF0400_01213 [Fusobacterium periodonticum 1_1_41FAA]
MAEFNSHIITNAGRNLLARALAGEGKVIFTKAAFGDQKHSGNLREVTELKNKKLDLNVMNIRNDNGTAVLTVQISNQNVDQSFQTEEFGVYAKIENDVSEVLYSYTTAVSADTFPNNRLGKTYESIQDIYMAISSDVEAEIYVRDGVIYLTRDIANQVYTETGITAVGTLKGRSNLEENKQYLADNGHWYKNIGGNRSWNSLGTPDEQLIPITWEYLYKSLNTKEGQLIQNLNGLLGKNNGQFPVDQAVEGNVYYFPANQKYYYCLKSQSGRTSVPNADFEEMSIWANKKKLENLTRKTILLFYNGGSLVPDGTTSIAINENWYFFGLGVGTAVQSGKERMCFLFRTIFQSNNDILRFNGIEIRYNATNKTLKVINNGGNLYFLEQYSSLI